MSLMSTPPSRIRFTTVWSAGIWPPVTLCSSIGQVVRSRPFCSSLRRSTLLATVVWAPVSRITQTFWPSTEASTRTRWPSRLRAVTTIVSAGQISSRLWLFVTVICWRAKSKETRCD